MEIVLSICPIASVKRANRFSLDPQRNGIRTGSTYRFWTRHALPLAETTGFVREIVVADTRCNIAVRRNCGHGHNQSQNANSPHTGHCYDSSASVSSPQPKPRSIRDRSHVHNHSAFNPNPRTGRNLVQSAQMAVSMIWQRQWTQTVRRQSAITLKPCA